MNKMQSLFKSIKDRLKKFTNKKTKPKYDVIRRLYRNRTGANSYCELVVGNRSEVERLAEYFYANEELETYIEDALIHLEESARIYSEHDREILRRGARLRNDFLRKCVKEVKSVDLTAQLNL